MIDKKLEVRSGKRHCYSFYPCFMFNER